MFPSRNSLQLKIREVRQRLMHSSSSCSTPVSPALPQQACAGTTTAAAAAAAAAAASLSPATTAAAGLHLHRQLAAAMPSPLLTDTTRSLVVSLAGAGGGSILSTAVTEAASGGANGLRVLAND